MIKPMALMLTQNVRLISVAEMSHKDYLPNPIRGIKKIKVLNSKSMELLAQQHYHCPKFQNQYNLEINCGKEI